MFWTSTWSLLLASLVSAFVYNTFDGDGFPSCYNVTEIHNPTSVDEIAFLVKDASQRGQQVRAAGKGHTWYDTQCSDDETILIRTELTNAISAFDLTQGIVTVEAGVTFFQLADFLHSHGASLGTGLVNWNITVAGAIAMGAHRTSIREDAAVVGAALALDIIDGRGEIRHVERNETDDEWLAASTSLGLLGIIARVQMRIYPETKVYAAQQTLEEEDVLNGDIYGMIAPYKTANFWWWPYTRKFHWRYYDDVDDGISNQTGFQSTFSVTAFEGNTARVLLDSGKTLPSSNWLAERIFFNIWEKPNFHEKVTNEAIAEWPVFGWSYDVLIGGLYPGELPEWEYGLHAYTLELAFPITRANDMLKRVRQLFDDEAARGYTIAATYRSGINIKFGKANLDLLGQVTYNTSDREDWSRGSIMLDFPSYKPSWGDRKRYDEEFYINLANTLVDEFPARAHWTKNTRDVLQRAVKNLDPGYLARFKAVRERFDPNALYRSVVGEILGKRSSVSYAQKDGESLGELHPGPVEPSQLLSSSNGPGIAVAFHGGKRFTDQQPPTRYISEILSERGFSLPRLSPDSRDRVFLLEQLAAQHSNS